MQWAVLPKTSGVTLITDGAARLAGAPQGRKQQVLQNLQEEPALLPSGDRSLGEVIFRAVLI